MLWICPLPHPGKRENETTPLQSSAALEAEAQKENSTAWQEFYCEVPTLFPKEDGPLPPLKESSDSHSLTVNNAEKPVTLHLV